MYGADNENMYIWHLLQPEAEEPAGQLAGGPAVLTRHDALTHFGRVLQEFTDSAGPTR
jgi:hypothetical protein